MARRNRELIARARLAEAREEILDMIRREVHWEGSFADQARKKNEGVLVRETKWDSRGHDRTALEAATVRVRPTAVGTVIRPRGQFRHFQRPMVDVNAAE